MTGTIDLNVDGGESLGRWRLGADEALAPLVSSLNVACGWHAGDAGTMAASVRLAKHHGLALGSHPGFPDLIGFGRREMAFSPDDAAQAVLYQTGALRAFADQQGVALAHVKAHGSLYGLLMRDDNVSDAVADAIGEMDSTLIQFLPAGHAADRQRRRGHRVAAEAFADLEYADDGRIVIDPENRRRDPEWCAEQVQAILGGHVRTADGSVIPIQADTVCLHSDRPGAEANAHAVTRTVAALGIAVRPPSP
ncbi:MULTISPECIES: LamB/YcsF family protein [unclassified Nesterenkonia]|uniref:LamB/YcsF family protein n=1 Tax=unclassified Nesterenkonia TaxID=2629769 RepID=UPI001F4C78FD|nr:MULTISPECIES: 5-oxoprolinase subunit PxpA [unclassified Nesterenkonia]MCH8559173.1 LamB/YcsF family protein [Nesterenkonia sp. DZ6]MCH8563086.1 LamB/YcsF family protein [Nesterenkonia sp. YGD6]